MRPDGRWRQLAPWIGIVGFMLAIALVWRSGWLSRLGDYERIVVEMGRGGALGPLACIAIQFVQVIVFFIPGEVTQVAAGYVFGAFRGFLYSLAGIMLGSAAAFALGRWLGRPWFARIFGEEALGRLHRAAGSPRGRWAVFLLFLTPGAPKDAMSYGAGLTGWPLGRFVLISGLGRTPALLASTLLGGQLQERDYGAMAATIGAAVAAGLAFWLYQRRAGWG